MLPPDDADPAPSPPIDLPPDAAPGAAASAEPLPEPLPEGLNERSWRARYLPAVLSAIVPGLGQLVRRRWILAAVFLLPVVALALFGLYVAATTTPTELIAELVDPTVIWLIIGLQVALLLWRLLAVGQNLFDRRLPRPGRRDVVPVIVLLVAVVAPQAYAGYVTNEARLTADTIFQQDTVTTGAWDPNGMAVPPDPSDFGTASPEPSPSPSPSSTPRLSVLLIGVDAGS